MAQWIKDLTGILLSRRITFVVISTASLSTTYKLFYNPEANSAFLVVATMQVILLLIIASSMRQEYSYYIQAICLDSINVNLTRLSELQRETEDRLRQIIKMQDKQIRLLEYQLKNTKP